MHDVNKLKPASTWTPRELYLAYRNSHLLAFAEVTGLALFIYIDLMMNLVRQTYKKDNVRSSPPSQQEALKLF